MTDLDLDAIRARAEAAKDSTRTDEWAATYGENEHSRVWCEGGVDDVEPLALILGYLNPADGRAAAEHIAGMDPATTLALCDEIDRLREEAMTAHNELVFLAMEISWATDGTLHTAVRHIKELVRRRNATIDRVRELHQPRTIQVTYGDCAAEECSHEEAWECPTRDFQQCVECDRIADESSTYYTENRADIAAYPCATIRALEGGEQDERIQAWEAIATHAAFADCYQEERPLLESVIDRIDALVSTSEAVVELAPSSLQAEIDRLNATIQRVREIEREMDEYSHRSGPCTGVNCGGCQAGRFSTALRHALEGGEQ